MTGQNRTTRRPAPLSRIAAIAVLLLVAGCAGRPGTNVLSAVNVLPPEGAQVVSVYAATTRMRENGPRGSPSPRGARC